MEEICRGIEEIERVLLLIGVVVVISYVRVLKWAMKEYKKEEGRRKKEEERWK